MRKQLLLLVMMLLPMVVSGYDFESDGVAYTILSVQDKTVSVSGLTSGGDIVIPDKVLFNDFWFDVVSLDDFFGQFQGGTPKNSSIKFNSVINANGLMLYGCNTSCYYVDDSNPYMKAVDGVLYSKDMSRIISFPMNKYCEEFVIPESVTSLDEYSFGANKYIIRLLFNDNIEELPEYFLYGIYYSGRIKYLKLSNKIKVIHGRCLYDIPFMEEIILPKDLEEVEKDPYWDYYGLPTGLTDVTIFNSKIANYVYKLNPTLHVFSRFEKLKVLHVKDSNPIAIDDNVFTEGQFFTIKLYVPKGTKEIYKSLEGWKNFYNIIEEEENPIQKNKCATPTILFENGEVVFKCETEDVEYVSEVTAVDAKKYYNGKLKFTNTYHISVYATKAGYENSETVTEEIDVRGLMGDMNEDGSLSVTDVTILIDRILKQK